MKQQCLLVICLAVLSLSSIRVDAEVLTVEGEVNTRTTTPLATQDVMARSILGITETRVLAKTVHYDSFTAKIVYIVQDASPSPNSDLKSRFPISNSKLNGTGFTAVRYIPVVEVKADYTLFYVGVGSAAGGMVLAALFMAACCLRRGADNALSAKDDYKMRRGRKFDDKAFSLLETTQNENKDIRDRLVELEMQMLQVHQLDQDEGKTTTVLRELLPDDVGLLEAHGGEPGDIAKVEIHKNTASGLKGSAPDALTGSSSRVLSGGGSSAAMTPSQKIMSRRIKLPGDDDEMSVAEMAKIKKEHWWKRSVEESLLGDQEAPPLSRSDLPSHGFQGAVCDEDILASSPDFDRGHWSIDHRPLPSLAQNLASRVTIAPSHIHGMGLFATKFVDSGTVLFTYVRPQKVSVPQLYPNELTLDFKYGADWPNRLRFVVQHPEKKDLYIIAEDPTVRGWGCLINSCRGTQLEPNCEFVWTPTTGAGETPWIRTTKTIPPLAELLLDYPYPESSDQLKQLLERQKSASAVALGGSPLPLSRSATSTYSMNSRADMPPVFGSKFATTPTGGTSATTAVSARFL